MDKGLAVLDIGVNTTAAEVKVPMPTRTLITGGRVITVDPAVPDLAKGDVLVEDGRIAAVGPSLPAENIAETIDASGMIVLPGLVNAHIHTWQTGLRGLAGDWAATNYFRAMHAGLATFFRPEDIYIANLVGALNQINSGTTTIVDWHHNNPTPAHSDAAIDGLLESGIRAVFLHGSPKPDPKPGQKPYSEIPMPRGEVERLRKGRLSSDDALVTMGLAILGPQMAVNEVCLTDFELARDYDLIASLHHSGARMMGPQAYAVAAAKGLIGPKVNIVHGNALAAADLDILIDNGATFCVTTEVEMQMAYGEPLSGRVRERGGWFGIGSDIESAFAADMFAVMRTTLQGERYFAGMRELARSGEAPFPIPVTTRDALRWGTIDGARMIHLDKRIGSLTPGKAADIILVRSNDLNMLAASNPVHAVVMYANPGNVDTVMIGGKLMKRDGRPLTPGLEDKALKLIASGERIQRDFRAVAPTASFAT
jgi:5-methylthioadenosine/S-adenosylhomocysteine deaminase